MLLNNKVILLVEDSPNDVDLTIRAFEKNKLGNQIVVVRDGEEALDYLFATGPYQDRDPTQLPQVVLLDLKLPKIDGFEVLKRLRSNEKTKRLPVVILTSSKEERDLGLGYDLGANSYVRKPVSFTEFNEAVKNLGMYWLLLNEAPPKGETGAAR